MTVRYDCGAYASSISLYWFHVIYWAKGLDGYTMVAIIHWIGIPLLILTITGPLAAFFYLSQVGRNHLRWLWVFCVGLGLVSVAEGIFIAHTFGGLFPDLGCFISLLTPVAAVFSLQVFRTWSKRQAKSSKISGLQHRWYLVGIILIPLFQLSAPAISYAYVRTCDTQNQVVAAPIISALQAYHQDTGRYPTDVRSLVPQYLASMPAVACAVPFLTRVDPEDAASNGWSLTFCENTASNDTYLTVPIIGSDLLQIYSLTRSRWSKGSSFEGFCAQ